MLSACGHGRARAVIIPVSVWVMVGDRPEPVAGVAPRSWHEVRDWSAALLLSRTGQEVAAWNRGCSNVAWSVERAP
jgi:hypothetical protein